MKIRIVLSRQTARWIAVLILGIRVFNSTTSFLTKMIGTNKVETCSSDEKTLSWGHSLSADTYGNAKLIVELCTQRDFSSFGIEREL